MDAKTFLNEKRYSVHQCLRVLYILIVRGILIYGGTFLILISHW